MSLRSLTNGILFKLRSRVAWSRAGYREKPAGSLANLNVWQEMRLVDLKKKYAARFEEFFNRDHALENYHYLHLLDVSPSTKTGGHRGPPLRGEGNCLDLGSKNFCYSHALHVYFKPKNLTGIEIDAYKIYEDFFSRHDYAEYFIKSLKKTIYLPMDFLSYSVIHDVITCFYPFVFIEPLLAWTLPESHFVPDQFFKHVNKCLAKNGFFVMVNQGDEEFVKASEFCGNSGLSLVGKAEVEQGFIHMNDVAFVSLWNKL